MDNNFVTKIILLLTLITVNIFCLYSLSASEIVLTQEMIDDVELQEAMKDDYCDEFSGCLNINKEKKDNG